MSATKLERAKTQLVIYHPFFATLLLRGELIPNATVTQTACVNARGQLFYNPAFVESLSVSQLTGLLAHEVLHKACLHVQRLGHRDLKRWNIATDWWINETLIKEGFTLPDGALRYQGAEALSADELYKLVDPVTSQAPMGGAGEDLSPNAGGGAPLSEGEAQAIEADIKVQVASAALAAKQRGKLSATLQQFVAAVIASKVPWYEVLEPLVQRKSMTDHSWRRPNKRFAPFGLYLPTTGTTPHMGPIVIQVDISGSISPEELAHYNGHLARIVEEAHPERVYILYTDTEVKHMTVVEQGEEVTLTYYSGGGTNMEAGLTYWQQQGLEADLFICLTDGCTDFSAAPPAGCPDIVWLITTPSITAPYGRTIHQEN